MARIQETAVGVLFFGALIGLGILTIALTDFDIFQKRERITVYFDRGAGLKLGDNVRIMGVIQGTVEEVTFLETPHQRPEQGGNYYVRTTLKLDIPLESFIKEDHKIWIRNANMLGGKVVDIDLGMQPVCLTAEQIMNGLYVFAQEAPFTEIGNLITDHRPAISNIVSNIDMIVENIKLISDEVYEGEGLAHELIYNDELAQSATEIFSSANDSFHKLGEIVGDLQTGKGPLSRILYDEEWSQGIDAVISGAEKVIDDVSEGSGILSAILYNEEWPQKISALLDSAQGIVTDARVGKGPLGLILSDEKLRDDLARTVSNFAKISEDIGVVSHNLAEGRGLLAMLLSDEEIAMKVRKLLEQIMMSVEDAREAAPLGSLGSFLFGTI